MPSDDERPAATALSASRERDATVPPVSQVGGHLHAAAGATGG